MSALPPIITDWELKGYDWKYVHQAVVRAFQVPALGQIELPYENFKYRFKEIVLLDIVIMVDDPTMGLRLRANPDYDSKTDLTVQNLMLAASRVLPTIFCTVPPNTPPGLFIVQIVAPYKWEEFLEISIINRDTVPHYYLGWIYDLCVTDRKPKVDVEA